MDFKIQDRDFGQYMTDIKLKLVRTYKGEINRTQLGTIAAFPTSFVTPGFECSFIASRDAITQLQQLLLSADLVLIETEYNGTKLKGKFSCTNNEVTELKDRKEAMSQLSIAVVSDGTSITKPDGSLFTIKEGATTLKSGAFGKVISVGAQYKYQGASLPSGQLLLLGDVQVTKG